MQKYYLILKKIFFLCFVYFLPIYIKVAYQVFGVWGRLNETHFEGQITALRLQQRLLASCEF